MARVHAIASQGLDVECFVLVPHQVGKSFVNVANSVSYGKRIANEGDPCFSWRASERVLLVVAEVPAVGHFFDVATDPAISRLGQGKGVSFIVDEAVINLTNQ